MLAVRPCLAAASLLCRYLCNGNLFRFGRRRVALGILGQSTPHFSETESFLALLRSPAQPMKNMIVTRLKNNFMTLFTLAEHFKAITSNAEFYSCMGISTSLPEFLFTIKTCEGVTRFNTYPSISNCSPARYSKPLIMAIFIFPAST